LLIIYDLWKKRKPFAGEAADHAFGSLRALVKGAWFLRIHFAELGLGSSSFLFFVVVLSVFREKFVAYILGGFKFWFVCG